MKWFLITLAIGLAATDKLDRTYLPPPGAQFAGGTLGHHDAPLEPPHHTHSGQAPTIGGQKGSQPNFGINGQTVNFGDKIPKVPVTTTSYAYSRTTTYPPAEGFEITALPINPITGLPIEFDEGNFPYGPSQGQAQNVGSNIQSGFPSASVPINHGTPGYNQFSNQPISQYPGQKTPTGIAQIPGSEYPGQNQGQFQYPGGQAEQLEILQTGAPNNQHLDHYPGQNVVNPGGITQIPGGTQDLVQYPGGQIATGQQGFVPSTGSPINQYEANYDDSLGPISQGTYTGQSINVQNLDGTQPTSYQNQEPINIGGTPSQYPTGNQNYGPSVPTGSENLYQPGSTPPPGVPSSASAYSSVGPIYRPERPQAVADRNAVILNYENIRTPNGYSYSFDTSNGIHADENGIVDNGTKAQGAYSYIGDDGKVYSVIYTADENGFQPRGDHLPTPPPIPEAIKRVIEQATRDKAAGIVHDGSYDEAKYGDKGYQGIGNRRPENKDANQFSNNEAQDDLVKPIVGIKDVEYDEDIAQNQFDNNQSITDTRKDGKLRARPSLHQINGENNVENISEGNRRISGDIDSKRVDFDSNGVPRVEEGTNQLNNYGNKKQGSSGRRPTSNGVENKLSGSINRRPSDRRPVSGDVNNVSGTKYPGSNVDVGVSDYSGGDKFDNVEDQNIESGKPNISAESRENINTNYDSVTGAPLTGNQKQILRQRIKGNRRPGLTDSRYNQNKIGRPTQQITEQDDTGYDYRQPNTKFEQNTFPTRFSPQETSTTRKPDQQRTDYVEGTTLKPFMTPNVYYEKNKNSRLTPTKYNQKDVNGQSTTRRPFMTVRVTSPSGNSYTDYDDGDDYSTDQDIGDDRIDSTKASGETNSTTSRPYQTAHTTSRPRINQKGTVTPERRTENSPGYSYGPTTPMPSHNSRFGSTETPRRMKPQQYRPSTTIPDPTTAVGRPVTSLSPSGTRPSDYKYQTTRPVSKYPGDNVGSGYPTTGAFPGRGSLTPTPGVSTPQDFYTSTYRPTQDYSNPATVPPTSGYTQDSGSLLPTGTPGPLQPSQEETFHTGYHYGPPKTGVFNPDKISGLGSSIPAEHVGVFPTTPAGTFQTTNQQGPGVFASTTSVPIMTGKQGTFIPSQLGTTAPGTSPFGTYQGTDQNGPSTPNYATTILASTPGGKPAFGYTGQPGLQQETTGYEYGPSRPSFITTDSPSTGSFIPPGTTNPSQDFTTTYRPGFHNEDTFVRGPVDGYGRPITPEYGGLRPGFGHSTQDATGPINNVGPNFDDFDQSTTYPGGYDQTRVIGEDFSGPKQPQRYDPKTGYHYK